VELKLIVLKYFTTIRRGLSIREGDVMYASVYQVLKDSCGIVEAVCVERASLSYISDICPVLEYDR